MRQIILDTETTGLSIKDGHRIIEIGCIEIIDRWYTDRQFHYYLNPERDIDQGALEVHGLTVDFLADKPRFADVADEFMAFIKDAEVVIHNAPFDVGFLNYELELLASNYQQVESHCQILDTLKLAKQLHPGMRNSLDALCKRYDVDNSNRSLHGALLDAQLLGDVYLAMTGGQASFELRQTENKKNTELLEKVNSSELKNKLTVIYANDEELNAHQQRLDEIDGISSGECLWLKQD